MISYSPIPHIQSYCGVYGIRHPFYYSSSTLLASSGDYNIDLFYIQLVTTKYMLEKQLKVKESSPLYQKPGTGNKCHPRKFYVENGVQRT